MPDAGESAVLDDVHDRVITLDTHVDIPFEFATDEVSALDGELQVNLRTMRNGGLDAGFFIVYVGQTERTPENYAQARTDAMTKFDAIHRMTDRLHSNLIGLAHTADDVGQIAAAGRLVAAIGIENGYVIGNDLDLLDRYYALGARYMTLVHNGHNDIADSAQPREEFGDDGPEHNGVSRFGAQVIARMNDLGMMVDISHASKQAALDAIALSRAPVIGSHSSVHALTAHVRNMDDETLLALRDNGGVVQIVAFASYLGDPESRDDADVGTLVDHIDYAVELIGVDHVGISSDFGGGGGIEGWNGAEETRNVTAELLARGYSEGDIAKIWSGNLLRVW
ncbi:MAG TPA: dipeptidase, partial [Gammaproteobacteria bacterium]|nr:dipeptidase [Gammaproteobacteria bacterium]